MASGDPVRLTTSGPPETVLPGSPPELVHLLARAGSSADPRAELVECARKFPRSSVVWAELADRTTDPIEKYAYFRVGYHRGLDTLRANGWRGSGYVRWAHDGNRGVLRCIQGLADSATAIGENDEAERCRLFVLQLEPGGIPTSS